MVTRSGSDDQGSHQSVVLDLLDHYDTRDLQDMTLLGITCVFGLVFGISLASLLHLKTRTKT